MSNVTRLDFRARTKQQANILPLPMKNILGPGRDRRFLIPQYVVEIDGLPIVFADQGEGPALIFVHGLAGNITHWVHVAPHFVHNHRVVAIDLPGHGESGRDTTRYGIDPFVEHIVKLMDVLRIDRGSIVGHSMGGMVGMAFALKHPDRTDAVVLVNPAGIHPVAKPARMAGHLLLKRTILDKILPKIWKNIILANVFYQSNEHTEAFLRMVEETYSVDDVHDISLMMEVMRNDLLERNFAGLLPKCACPVGLIWGEKDRLVPARLLHEVAKRLANVQVVEIERCGHMPNIEQPDRVVRFIEHVMSRT